MHRAIVLLAVLLLIGGNACLLHSGEQQGEDLCFALVAVTAIPVLAFVLIVAGEIQPASALAFAHFRPDPATPPPRA